MMKIKKIKIRLDLENDQPLEYGGLADIEFPETVKIRSGAKYLLARVVPDYVESLQKILIILSEEMKKMIEDGRVP